MAVTIEEIKKVINETVGEDRTATLTEDDYLVQGGVISSLEIVTIGLALEKRYGISIPDNQLTVANFATLSTLADMVKRLCENASGTATAATEWHDTATDGVLLQWVKGSLTRCFRYPISMLIVIACMICLTDQAILPKVMAHGVIGEEYDKFREHGARLYPSSGGWAQDSLLNAVEWHEIITHPMRGAKPAIAFFGDSGTVGSFVRPEDAPPAQAEFFLRGKFPKAKVYNLAFFMRALAKDVMIIEALLEKNDGKLPFDTVILTLCDAYYHIDAQRGFYSAVPYFSLNRRLLANFEKRMRSKRPEAYTSVLRELTTANKKFRGLWSEYIVERSNLVYYKPFFTLMKYYHDDVSGY